MSHYSIVTTTGTTTGALPRGVFVMTQVPTKVGMPKRATTGTTTGATTVTARLMMQSLPRLIGIPFGDAKGGDNWGDNWGDNRGAPLWCVRDVAEPAPTYRGPLRGCQKGRQLGDNGIQYLDLSNSCIYFLGTFPNFPRSFFYLNH
jgi:hypothetical protein